MKYFRSFWRELSVLAFIGVGLLGMAHTGSAIENINTAVALDQAISRLTALEPQGAECRIRLWAIQGEEPNFFEYQEQYDFDKEKYGPFRELLTQAGRDNGVSIDPLLTNINSALASVGRTQEESVALRFALGTYKEALDDVGFGEQFFENLKCVLEAGAAYEAGEDIDPVNTIGCAADTFNAAVKEVSSWSRIAALGKEARKMQGHSMELSRQIQTILDPPPILRGYTNTAQDIARGHEAIKLLTAFEIYEETGWKQGILDGIKVYSNGAIEIQNPLYKDALELMQESGALALEATAAYEAAVNTCLDTTRYSNTLQTGYKPTGTSGSYQIYASTPKDSVCEWDLTATLPDGTTQALTGDSCRFTADLAPGTKVTGTVRALGSFLEDLVDIAVGLADDAINGSSCDIRDIEAGEDGEKKVHATVKPCWYENSKISIDPSDIPTLDDSLIDTLEVCATTKLDLGTVQLDAGPFCTPLRDLLDVLNVNTGGGGTTPPPDPPKSNCERDEDCPDPQVCRPNDDNTALMCQTDSGGGGTTDPPQQNECVTEGQDCGTGGVCRTQGGALVCVLGSTNANDECSKVGEQDTCGEGEICTEILSGTGVKECRARSTQTGDCPPGSICFDPPSKFQDLVSLVNEIINWAMIVGSVIAVMMVIVTGIMYMTSGGDSFRAQYASRMLAYVAVGVLILYIAKGLALILMTIFGYR